MAISCWASKEELHLAAEQERASTFFMMRAIGRFDGGLTKDELWDHLVKFSRREGVDSDVVLLVGINGHLEEYLGKRIFLGYIEIDTNNKFLRDDWKLKLSEKGKKFLKENKAEADRLILKHIYCEGE